MPKLELTDTSTESLRSALASGIESNERALVEAVLQKALDIVSLAGVTRSSLDKLERFGLPAICAGAVQTWTAPGPDPAPASANFVRRPAPGSGWLGLEDIPFKSVLGTSLSMRHEACWAMEEQGIVAVSAASGIAEFTAASISPSLLPSLAAGLHALLGPGGRIDVPVDQQTVMDALNSAGFRPGCVQLRWMLAPMLSYSMAPVLLRDYRVSINEVEAFGRSSGDLNPLHFDDSFARSHGFTGRITHGMIFNGWVTRLLGTEYPGEGTIFLRNKVVYFAPVYPDRAYQIRVSTPTMDQSRGTHHILAQLRDEDGAVAMLSYNDVMLRQAALPGRH